LPTGINATHVVAACPGFDEITAADVNTLDDVLDLATDAFSATSGLAFVKTGKGQEVSKKQVPSSEFSQATEVTTTKTFVGGKVFADMSATDQGLERLGLYSDCSVGTPPTNLAGAWRAVTIVEDPVPYVDGVATPPTDATTVRTTTTKVCVNFDATPGVTKCYVDVDAPGTANDSEQIAIYDGENLHTVIGNMVLSAITAGTAVDFIASGDVDPTRLCRLF
jgi:hypothetical protein